MRWRWSRGLYRTLPLLLALGGAAMPARAQSPAVRGDSAAGPLFSRRDAWVAVGFVAATVAALPLDEIVAHNLQLPQNQNEPGLVRVSAVFRDLADPGTLYIGGGLYAAGILFHDASLADMGVHASEALALASVAGFVLKGAVGRPLPRQANADADSYKFGRGIRVDGNWQAFPSGHTLAAFSIASAVTAEAMDRWPSRGMLVGALMYGSATASGISRLYNNAHWVSDVIFGAGIGIFSGIKTVQYDHAHPDNWLNRMMLHGAVSPDARGGVDVGLHFTTGAGSGR
ncbi:MAG: phosphatase PAP2 family protein [Gemmatimonadota bacterium]|nr:phosphatase PAP2 family protein [Gemmatimonadota bacterium]